MCVSVLDGLGLDHLSDVIALPIHGIEAGAVGVQDSEVGQIADLAHLLAIAIQKTIKARRADRTCAGSKKSPHGDF